MKMLQDILLKIQGKTIRYISPTEAEFRAALEQKGTAIPQEYISIIWA